MDSEVELRHELTKARERETALRDEVRRLRSRLTRLERVLEGVEREREEFRQTVLRLEQRNRDLEMRTRQDSATSHRPPSQDPEWEKEKRRKERAKRKKANAKKRGAQKGHKGTRRSFVTPDHVERVEPTECEHCHHGLDGAVARPVDRRQVTELPELRALVTEYRRYAKTCSCCGKTTVGSLPRGVEATGCFGPRLRTTLALWTGYHRMSRRRARLLMKPLFGVEISVGAVSENERHFTDALGGAYGEASAYVRRSPHLHADETTFRQENSMHWLWTAVTRKVSVYRVEARRNTDAAKRLLEGFRGLLTTDQCGSYLFYPLSKRQFCWAHLLRDAKHLAEHGTHRHARPWAKRMLRLVRRMFREWHRIRDGTVPYNERRVRMKPHKQAIEECLDEGLRSEDKAVRKYCRSVTKHPECLWRFIVYGTEPTNNNAERALKPAVLWRKTSFGTQSERGSRFFERMLTVIESLRSQGRDVFDFLMRTLSQSFHGGTLPLLAPSE